MSSRNTVNKLPAVEWSMTSENAMISAVENGPPVMVTLQFTNGPVYVSEPVIANPPLEVAGVPSHAQLTVSPRTEPVL